MDRISKGCEDTELHNGGRVEEYSSDDGTGNQANVNTKPLLTLRITKICARKVIIHDMCINRIYTVIKYATYQSYQNYDIPGRQGAKKCMCGTVWGDGKEGQMSK